MKSNYNLVQNPLGYFEIQPKPSDQDLLAHYNNTYFNTSTTQYTTSYTDAELTNKYLRCIETETYLTRNVGRLLDLGCGEGFNLNYFNKKKWQVTGVDFTADGVKHFFPELATQAHFGNLFDVTQKLVAQKQQFDIIYCDNVLEHVKNPLELLLEIKKLMAPGGICRIVVPNDYSILQTYLVEKKLTPPNYWICYPDHLNYFNTSSFLNILKKVEFNVLDLLADFPIDIFLLNKDSNFKQDSAKGKNCHYARVEFENMLAAQSIQNLIEFRRGCAKAHVGRNLIAYCRNS